MTHRTKSSRSLRELLPAVLAKVKRSLLEDETLGEFVENREKLEEFIGRQAGLIVDYFAAFEEPERFEEGRIGRFYETASVPYPVVYKNLNLLKNELMKRIAETTEDSQALFDVETFIDRYSNLVAKEYIRKEAERLECVGRSVFRSKLLYRAHTEWVEAIGRAIVEEDMERFPLVSARDCLFGTYLAYPEAMMVCMEEGLCHFLQDLHLLIHRNANTYFLLWAKEDFVQAYIAFKDLLLQVINFSKTISELYFVTYANLEERFFRLVEMLAWSHRRMQLSILDVRELKALNRQYGEELLNRVLDEAERRINGIIDGDDDRVLAIRGSTATFYMLNLDFDDEEMARFAARVYKELDAPFVVDDKRIEVRFSMATLEMEGFHEKSRDDLTKLLLYLKKRAQSMACAYIVRESEEKRALHRWLVQAYSDIHRIEEKVRRKEIEVLFQPIYRMESGEIEIVEALVRLKEGKKLLPASLFIDTVHELDMIDRIDIAVMERIVEKLSTIRKVATRVFVNVSYKSLLRPEYRRALERAVERFGPDFVVCELTEQQIVENVEQVKEIHRTLGIHFAVDDFGSGYSSLKTVADLAREGILWAVKVDGSLVERVVEDDYAREMVQLIAQMCRVISVASVAEFVENEEMLAIVRRIGITHAQGFHMGRPRRIEELLVEKVNAHTQL